MVESVNPKRGNENQRGGAERRSVDVRQGEEKGLIEAKGNGT
jgi:hypothetical protein